MTAKIFEAPVPQTLHSLCEPNVRKKQKLVYLSLVIALSGAVGLGVILFEAHIVTSTFAFIFGEENQFWKPWIMGFASLILVLAVHLMARKNAHHPALQFINRAAGFLVPVYLLGIGALIMVTLYNGGLSEMLSAQDVTLDFDGLLDANEQEDDWFTSLMAIISPLAGLLFSLGIGSLAVVSVFVANSALTMTETKFSEAAEIYRNAKADQQDLEVYLQSQREYDTLQSDIDEAMMCDITDLQASLANEVYLTIQKALEPTLAFINKEKFTQRPTELAVPNTVNTQAIEKAIKPIQAITRADIIKAKN